MAQNAIAAGLSALAGLVWTVSAVVVERWCVIKPDDEDAAGDGRCPA